jgi:hypothetical protein
VTATRERHTNELEGVEAVSAGDVNEIFDV